MTEARPRPVDASLQGARQMNRQTASLCDGETIGAGVASGMAPGKYNRKSPGFGTRRVKVPILTLLLAHSEALGTLLKFSAF